MWIEADTPCINLTLNRWNAGFEMYRSALEHNSYFFMYKVVSRAKPWMFDSIYIKGNQLQLFQKIVAYFNAAYIKNNDLQC